MKKIFLLTALCAGLVNAQAKDNWVNASGEPWKNSTGQCWRNSSWTPATAHPDCDGALKPPQQVAQITKPAEVDITKPTAVIASRPASAPPAKVSLSADTLFDFDKSVVKPEGQTVLNNLANGIKGIKLEVIIAVGNTDSVGTDAYNMALGQRRAQTVKAYLVSKGIDGSRIYTESKGKSNPVASNATTEGRAKNRRVDIEVVGTK